MTRGFTMVELIATLAILGVTAAVTTVSVGSLRVLPRGRALDRIEAARRTAIMTGTATRVAGDSACALLFLPDGSAVGARCTVDSTAFSVDPLSGAVHAAR